MKIKGLIVNLLVLLHLTVGHASDIPTDSPLKKKPGPFSLQAMANYNDFKFNSSTAGSYNRFQGHSDLFLVGGHDEKLKEDVSAGILFYNLSTRITSNVLLAPTSLVTTNQKITNNNVMAHVLKQIKPNLYIDLLGNYGQSSLSYLTTIDANTANAQVSSAKNHASNWFVSVTGEHVHPWRQLILKGFLSLLHSETSLSPYNYYFTPSNATPVASISNQATFLLENAEITYAASSHIQPFINGGLLQVLQYSNSRPIVSNVILVGTLPEFNINQNGFRVGGGVSLFYKKIILRLEQQYDQRGTVYHSNQTIAAITYTMS